MTKRPFWILLAVSTLAGCASAEGHTTEKNAAPASVAVATVKPEPLDVLYRASGTVRGHNTAVLTSKTTGYVRKVEVKSGDVVEAGQLLAVLEANDVEASVRRAWAGMTQAQEARTEAENGVRAAEAAAQIAKTTRDRMAALFADGSIPKQQLDDSEAQFRATAAQEEMARARLRGSSARIEQARAEVGEAKATLDYARITAPFAGRVVERRVDPGNLASPGMPLLVVEEQGKLRVEAAVEETRAPALRIGDAATVEVDGASAPLAGTVTEIVPNVDVASRAFLVKVDLPDSATTLRPGMFARANFRVGTRERLVVPRTAVTELGALQRVFVLDGERARLRMITTGETRGDVVEVLSGLAPGDRIVPAPPADLKDGARVKVSS